MSKDSITGGRVPTRKLFSRLGGWMAYTALVLSAFPGLYGWDARRKAEAMQDRGETARATVVLVETIEADDDTSAPSYSRDLHFVTAAGLEMTVGQPITKDEAEARPSGETLSLTYLPDEPAIFETTPGFYADAARNNRVASRVLLGLALVLALWAGQRTRKAIAARDSGTIAKARVTGSRRERKSFLNRHRLLWEDGEGRKGQSMPHKYARLRRFRKGQNITVYQTPERVWWIGDLGPR